MSISKDALQELKERSHLPQVFPQRLHCLYFFSYSVHIFIPSKLFFTFSFPLQCLTMIQKYTAFPMEEEKKINKASSLFHICKSQDLREESDFSPGTVPSTLANQW